MKETERSAGSDETPGPVAKDTAAKGGSLPSLPGFEIQSEVGRGGMGVVYKARQTALGRIVALKVLPGGLWAGEEEVERFRREARAAGALDHPAIVEAHEVGESGGVHYIVQEFVDGTSLDRWIRDEGGTLPPRRAAEILLPVVEGVAHAHSRGVVH
ncbi:MAG: protein kinase, partial [Planctomycetes bacterium]|nr:protein kinase [Planctomycetota bacterium]